MGIWTYNETDSKIFNKKVFDINYRDSLSPFDHSKKLNELDLEYPDIANVFSPVNCIENIALYTSKGFDFIECRFTIEKELSVHYSSNNLYPYVFERVNEEETLNELIHQCQDMAFDDRYTCDPLFHSELSSRNRPSILRRLCLLSILLPCFSLVTTSRSGM